MFSGVQSWWVFLSVVSVLNIALLMISGFVLYKKHAGVSSGNNYFRRIVYWLSAVYVAGCAFRSFLPRIDLERIVLVDSWLSSMLVGRVVATVAELSFITQCAILLYVIAKAANSRYSQWVSIWLVPVICIAEAFSWYAILTTNYFGSVVEESLWTMAGIFMLFSFIMLWSKVSGTLRHFFSFMIMFAVGFILFMVTVDVPMYWQRWQQDLAMNIQYLPIWQGIEDAVLNYQVSFSPDHWAEEMPWMTLYFSVAVWVSLYLCHSPVFNEPADKS